MAPAQYITPTSHLLSSLQPARISQSARQAGPAGQDFPQAGADRARLGVIGLISNHLVSSRLNQAATSGFSLDVIKKNKYKIMEIIENLNSKFCLTPVKYSRRNRKNQFNERKSNKKIS